MDTDPAAAAPTVGQIEEWFTKLSNWGRWGADDSLGTLNLITADKRLAAAASVRHGRAVSCSWDLPLNQPAVGILPSPQRWMARTGLGFNDPVVPEHPRSIFGEITTATEILSIFFHGQTITHLDALSHVHFRGQMYGGRPASLVTDWDGALALDVLPATKGMVSRGVLLDVPRARGVEALAPGEPIFPADLDRAAEVQGVDVQPGDILLVRTGAGLVRQRRGPSPAEEGWPGLQAACLPWVHSKDIAAIGADVPQDVLPSGYPDMALPFHAVGIVAMGLWLIDNCQLEDLADACEELSQYEFMLSVNPLRLPGVTGSPVNPVALL